MVVEISRSGPELWTTDLTASMAEKNAKIKRMQKVFRGITYNKTVKQIGTCENENQKSFKT